MFGLQLLATICAYHEGCSNQLRPLPGSESLTLDGDVADPGTSRLDASQACYLHQQLALVLRRNENELG